jgi:hypothetical protein
MKDSLPSLILFIVAGTLALAAKIFQIEDLMIATKPMVIPAIFYYYLQTKTRRANLMFSLALWLFFISDMVMVLFPLTGMPWIMVTSMSSYLILIGFALYDRTAIKFSAFNVVFITLLLILLGYFTFTILSLNVESIVSNYGMYLAYGIVLTSLAVVAAANYLSDNSVVSLHLSSMALCMVVSDLFFCIYRFVIKLPIIDDINLFSQFMSYFFMVRYFNSRRKAIQPQPEFKS